MPIVLLPKMYERQDISNSAIEVLKVPEFIYIKLSLAVDLCFQCNPRTAVRQTWGINLTPPVLVPNVYKCPDVDNSGWIDVCI